MIRPFALADILLVYRLQNEGVPLAIEHILTHPRPPLWLALTAPWPWAGRGVATYVLRERSQGRQIQGFVQLLKRVCPARGRPVAHVALRMLSRPKATQYPMQYGVVCCSTVVRKRRGMGCSVCLPVSRTVDLRWLACGMLDSACMRGRPSIGCLRRRRPCRFRRDFAASPRVIVGPCSACTHAAPLALYNKQRAR